MTINLIDQHKNLNGIQVSDQLTDVGEGVVEAANAITPGMIVTKGTAAGELIPDNASGNHSGYALENQKISVGGEIVTLRTAFAAGERVRYGRTIGKKFMGLIASGQNLTKDQLLQTASGKLVIFTEAGANDSTQLACARIVQEGGTGGALGADGYFLCKWGA